MLDERGLLADAFSGLDNFIKGIRDETGFAD